jgi:hypothetical protein
MVWRALQPEFSLFTTGMKAFVAKNRYRTQKLFLPYLPKSHSRYKHVRIRKNPDTKFCKSR